MWNQSQGLFYSHFGKFDFFWLYLEVVLAKLCWNPSSKSQMFLKISFGNCRPSGKEIHQGKMSTPKFCQSVTVYYTSPIIHKVTTLIFPVLKFVEILTRSTHLLRLPRTESNYPKSYETIQTVHYGQLYVQAVIHELYLIIQLLKWY